MAAGGAFLWSDENRTSAAVKPPRGTPALPPGHTELRVWSLAPSTQGFYSWLVLLSALISQCLGHIQESWPVDRKAFRNGACLAGPAHVPPLGCLVQVGSLWLGSGRGELRGKEQSDRLPCVPVPLPHHPMEHFARCYSHLSLLSLPESGISEAEYVMQPVSA